MIKFLLDVFCADTIVGLSKFSDIKPKKDDFSSLKCFFYNQYSNNKLNFTDPTACHF